MSRVSRDSSAHHHHLPTETHRQSVIAAFQPMKDSDKVQTAATGAEEEIERSRSEALETYNQGELVVVRCGHALHLQ